MAIKNLMPKMKAKKYYQTIINFRKALIMRIQELYKYSGLFLCKKNYIKLDHKIRN